MCGICGVVSHRPVTTIIFEALRRLEYRGYDSAGIAVITDNGNIERRRAAGKLDNLEEKLKNSPLNGTIGIGHTRWATHGKPTENNAHPHKIGKVAVVHNGIIENFQTLKKDLEKKGCVFLSDTDSEVIAHLVNLYLTQGDSPENASSKTFKQLEGTYAISLIFEDHDNLLIGARYGAPLAIACGDNEMFIGSDSLALAALSRKIIYLEDGDWCVLHREGYKIFNSKDEEVSRPLQIAALVDSQIGKDGYKHFMQKELHEHPIAIAQTLQRIIDPKTRSINLLDFEKLTKNIKNLTISACGSAYYAGLVGRYWIEELARIPVEIDVASEMRYRAPPKSDDGMALLISQSGETADTLGVLRFLKEQDQKIVSILNMEHSSMARESDLVIGMSAGPEISVASTKAFTAQLSVLAVIAIILGKVKQTISTSEQKRLLDILLALPSQISEIFGHVSAIKEMAKVISKAKDVLYLGRGSCMPIAQEGALKLKEITYIHAEAYAAGELKHGPISLIDETVPVVAIAPSTILFDKMLSNLQEVKARGGNIIAFTDKDGFDKLKGVVDKILVLPKTDSFVSPILYSVPVQMLAYETALLKGTDVDQPRNLAKSVTVE